MSAMVERVAKAIAEQKVQSLDWRCHEKTARAAIAVTLQEFGDWLETVRPDPVQTEISPEVKNVILNTLKWAIGEARKLAKIHEH